MPIPIITIITAITWAHKG